jgi:hypothetical protein
MHRLDGGDRRHAQLDASGEKIRGRPVIGASRAWVADIGGEEFEEAHRRVLAGGRDERRQDCGTVLARSSSAISPMAWLDLLMYRSDLRGERIHIA